MKMARNILTLSVMTMINTLSATAQNMSFGANNFYRSDNVTVQPIIFQNHYQMNMAGNLFTGNHLNLSTEWSAIVVGHPMGAVKEQSANLYATKLAEQGFVTMSLDLPFWGGSEGEPRNGVMPDLFSEAYSAAVDYLGQQSFVDRERIGALGVCASGGFVISAAKLDQRIKAIATSSMYDMGAFNRNGLQNSTDIEQRMEFLETASEDRWTVVDGGESAVAGGTPTAITNDTNAIGREFYDFYRTSRGEFVPEGVTPNSTTTRTYLDEAKFMNFYPFNDIETISPRPMLFVTGDRAHSREFSQDAYARAGEPKELVWIPNANHVDLYDRVELIPFAKFTQFFKTNL